MNRNFWFLNQTNKISENVDIGNVKDINVSCHKNEFRYKATEEELPYDRDPNTDFVSCDTMTSILSKGFIGRIFPGLTLRKLAIGHLILANVQCFEQ